jgi:PKD domain/Secretion system C-terminal sorting domain
MRGVKFFTLMLLAAACLMLCVPGRAYSQAETHNFITYDTTFTNSPGDVWNAIITRPSGLFGNGPDTASRPLIIMMPGVGQMGSSDFSLLTQYGPHYWLANGWDGGVQLGNGKHYPIIISVNHVSNDYPAPYQYYAVLTYILQHYHIKANSVYGTGLSEGSFTTSGVIEYEQTIGDHAGMKLFNALACFEGTPTTPYTSWPTTPTPYPNSQWADTAYFATWATVYHGRYFYLEGSGSDNFRDGWRYADAMNDVAPKSAFFSYEDAGGGAHCCWNTMYDPSETNWTSVGTLGPYNSPSQMGTNTMGDYTGGNVYQWMMRQGDTSLVGSSTTTTNTPPTVSTNSSAQTITLPTNSVSLTGSATANNGGSISSYSWSEVSGGAAAFGSASAANTTVTGLVAGTYVFKLIATDNGGNTASSTVQVVVDAATTATPPTVSTNSSAQTITLPTNSVTLTGSATANNGGSIASYSWSEVSGGAATIGSASAASTTITGLAAGTYVFQLTATDNTGDAASSTVQVVVDAATAPPPTTAPSPCSVYYWDSTNINLALTNANYPNIHPCDTIYIDHCKPQGGYRSLVIKLSSATPWKYSTLDSNRINLIFRGGYIQPNASGNMFLNGIDASNNLLIEGLKMYDHTDPLFTSVTATGYLHHIKFLKDTLQNIPGLWGSGPISTGLPNFTGNNDTTNCNYDIWFHQCVFDTIGNTTYGGLVAIWIGGFQKNQVWVKTEIDSSYFNYAPSPAPAGPACFIHAQQAYMIKIHDNTFSNLGVVATPSGHAGSIFMQGSLFEVYHNIFKSDFSNCVRAISQGTVPGMNSLFKTWDPNYDGVSRFWGNILDSGRKYPMIEDQKDTIGFSGLSYYQPMRSARVWNNTMYRGGTGAGDQPYNVSVYDWYEVAYTSDTLEMHNNIEVGPPSDTVGTMCSSQACVALLTRPSGITAFYDTSGNQFFQQMTLATSGLADAVHFYPVLNGLLYNNGVSVPAWLTKDFYGQPVPTTGRPAFARNTGVDVGAVQYNSGQPSPPAASAGPNQTITLPTSTATLTGSGSETNGTIKSYAWTQVTGPNTAIFGTAASPATTVSGLAQGVYTFKLTVTDATGVTASATMTVTVNPAVVTAGPPVANAGSNQTITLPTNSATLTGSGSEANGTIKSYAWTESSGPSTAVIGSASLATTTVSGLAQGTYTFKLTVTDATGATASATVTVTVNPAVVTAGPPVANAGSNQSITLPTNSATLTGSGSETNGTISSYAWTESSGPSTATIGSASSASTTVSNLVQGTYAFKLTVTDATGATASATVTVTVNPAPVTPGAPVASAGSDQTITLPTNSSVLTGSGSETNGTISSYAWTQVSGPNTAAFGSAGSATTTVSGLAQGSYTFKLTVTDATGVTASATMTVTVNAAAVTPGAPVANAGSNQSITLPTNSVTLIGSGSETNGSISSYAWTQVSGPNTAAFGSAGSATTTVSGLAQGSYTFKLTVTDATGVTATATVTVTVNAAPVTPGTPVANAGSDQTITLPTSSTTLSGSGSETNGTIVSYMWSEDSGPGTAVFGSASSAATTVSGLAQGVYTFELKVTDATGASATATVTVTVNAAAVTSGAPVANAGSNQSIILPTNSVTLSGSGSETNGTIVSYTWSEDSGPNTVSFGSASSASTTVSGLAQGVYTFELKVTDATGASATATVTVTVNPHQPPVANAGPNQTTTSTSGVMLNGTASYDPGGTIVSYAWAQVSGLGGVTISEETTATPVLYGLAPGVYVFQLTVTDNAGLSASATVTITVSGNSTGSGSGDSTTSGQAPVAVVRDTTVYYPGGDTALLNGSGSYAPGSSIAAYSWTMVSGPQEEYIGNNGSSVGIIAGMIPGDYVFRLTVTNSGGDTASANMTVHVLDNERTAQTIGMYPNPLPAGQQVTIAGTNGYAGQIKFLVMDMSGKVVKAVVMDKQAPNFVQTIDMTGLSRGTYIIQLQYYNQKPTVLKLVVD